MKRLSVASLSSVFQLVSSGDNEEDTVCCQGQTAKLHSRLGRIEDGKQVSGSFNQVSNKSLFFKGVKRQICNF